MRAKVRLCLMCQQPLPPLRWWEKVLTPPPFHDMRRFPSCDVLFRHRVDRIIASNKSPKEGE